MKTKYKIIVACLIFMIGGKVVAENRIMTLQECIDSAIMRNEKMKIASLSLNKATTLKATAFDIPQTSVTLQQETTGSAGLDNGVTVSQDFEFPTVYIAKHKVLKAQEQHEQNNFAIARNEIIKDVTLAYYTLLYQRELLRINQAQDSLYRQFENVAKSRYINGECSKLEPMNAERLVNTCNVALKTRQNEYEAAQREMMYLLNENTPIDPADKNLSIIVATIAPENIDFASSPQGKATESEIAINKSNLSLARQQLLPEFSISATAQAMIKSFNPYNVDRTRFKQGNFMGFEVGVSVPLFFGAQRARIKAAKSDLEISQLNQDIAKKEAENDYNNTLNRFNTAVQSLEYYTNSGAAQASELVRIANVSYNLGDINYMEYINNIETSYEMQRNYADAIYEYNQTIIYLNYLTGK
jgi:cobalt-zinc-cadmium resistance protein CzcA